MKISVNSFKLTLLNKSLQAHMYKSMYDLENIQQDVTLVVEAAFHLLKDTIKLIFQKSNSMWMFSSSVALP